MRIEIADLGQWGDAAALLSEYDPESSAIRINARILATLEPCKRAEFVRRAIAHELYHRFEHINKMPHLRSHKDRETAADNFASRLANARPWFDKLTMTL